MDVEHLPKLILAPKRGNTKHFLTYILLFFILSGQSQDLILDTQRGKVGVSYTMPTDGIVKPARPDLKAPFRFVKKSREDEGIVYLDMKKEVCQEILRAKPEHLEVTIPVDATHALELELEKVNVLSPDFVVTTSSGRVDDTYVDRSVFYRGNVKGAADGWAVMNIYDGKLSIAINGEDGFYSLTKVTGKNNYIFFNERRIETNRSFQCQYESDGNEFSRRSAYSKLKHEDPNCADCAVRVYVEVDYQGVINFREDPMTPAIPKNDQIANLVTGIFAQVITIYCEVGIHLEVSQLKIGDSDNYTYNPANGNQRDLQGILDNFKAKKQNNYNGMLAHLIRIPPALQPGEFVDIAGYADIPQSLCRENGGPYGVSEINQASEGTLFLSSVSLVAHEIGHNFGAEHTHKCVWGIDGMTAIDNCVALQNRNPMEGDNGQCNGNVLIDAASIIGSGGDYETGTIMSYCPAAGTLEFYSGAALGFNGPLEVVKAQYAEALMDCIGEITVYEDKDEDGFGDQSAPAMVVCRDEVPANAVTNNLDCDDREEQGKRINPNTKEICGNGVDDNCNGVTDEPNLALNFDGVDDQVKFGSSLGNFGTGDFTVEARIRTTEKNDQILSKRGICDNTNFWQIQITPEGKIRFEMRENDNGDNGGTVTSETDITDGRWHHIAVTRKNGEVQVIVDGEKEASRTLTTNIDNTTELELGTHICSSFDPMINFSGSIDELRIWEVGRTAIQIKELKDAAISPNQEGLVAYYDFNNLNATGGMPNTDITTVADRTGNNNTGTLSNFTLDRTVSNWIDEQGNGKTEECEVDTDGDGIDDSQDSDPNDPCVPVQSACYKDYDETNTIWAAADCDGDEVTNGEEVSNGTNPYAAPTSTTCVEEVAKLVATDFGEGNSTEMNFGQSVSISGNYAIAGAPYLGTPGLAYGAAYIFEKDVNGNWKNIQRIFPDEDIDSRNFFGWSVSISGNYAIVGANTFSNTVYVYERSSNGTWQEIQAIQGERNFGQAVSISGNRAIIGAPGFINDRDGIAYIYERGGNGAWQEVQSIMSSDYENEDRFGKSVSISGDYAIVGASDDDMAQGAAYVFKRNATGAWQEIQKLTASDGKPGDVFGRAVAISGNYAIVGANAESYEAYIFGRVNNTWQEIQKITLSGKNQNPWQSIWHGWVDITEDYAIVGGYEADDTGMNSSENAGITHIYKRNANDTWQKIKEITASDKQANDHFGRAVALSEEYAMVGAWGYDQVNSNTGEVEIENLGSAYLYKLDCEEEFKVDTDGDGIDDSEEITNQTDPNDPCDPPRAADYAGYDATNPTWAAADCDGDDVTNGEEVCNGTDPYAAPTSTTSVEEAAQLVAFGSAYLYRLNREEESNDNDNVLNFDGTNDYVDLGDVEALNFGTSDFTIEFWMKTNKTPATATPIVSKRPVCNPSNLWLVEMNAMGQIVLGLGEFNPTSVQSSVSVNDGNWRHIAVTRAGTAISIFVDGTLENTETTVDPGSMNTVVFDLNNSAPVQIGSDVCVVQTVEEYFQGSLDELRFWDRALDAATILSEKDCKLKGNEAGLIAYYDFNQGVSAGNNPTETTLLDRTANGINGTLTNFALTGGTSNWIAGDALDPDCEQLEEDRCADPPMITCGDMINGNTSEGENIFDSYLGENYSGKELIYQLDIPVKSEVFIGLNPFEGDLDLHLLSSCELPNTMNRIAHSWEIGLSYEEIYTVLEPGAYYVLVDGHSGAQSTFDLEVECRCADVPFMSCGDNKSGNTGDGVNAYQSYGRGDYGGSEFVYQLDIRDIKEVDIQLTDLTADLDMYLVMNDCDPTLEENRLAESINTGTASESIMKTLEAGTYFIVIDGFEGAESTFDISVNCSEKSERNNLGLDNSSGIPLSINLPQPTDVQIFPNPFRRQTTIQYQLPKSTSVILEVYDLNGQRLTQPLVNSVQDAGEYQVTFEVGNYAGGIYMVYLKTDDQVISKRMILID